MESNVLSAEDAAHCLKPMRPPGPGDAPLTMFSIEPR